eukprot:TRINITY_DN65744_c0_g1_i1.p2 TRINITY_DN65744_c0_g1~~TRINITY_DN65744_c0_g1_i1.p2  ORF type:complete len:699 (+),score=391.75 TRINITY_DN65744_c0_g1_i1:101-2098(+)
MKTYVMLTIIAAAALHAAMAAHPDKAFPECAAYGDYRGLGDAATSQCSCHIETTHNDAGNLDGYGPVTLLTGNGESRLENNQLYLVFTQPVKFYYPGGNTAPQTFFTNDADPTKGSKCVFTWTSQLTAACQIEWTGQIAWSDAYRTEDDDGCGFQYTNENGVASLNMDFKVTTLEDLPAFDTEGDRADRPPREQVHPMPFRVEYPQQLTVETDDVFIFGRPEDITSNVPVRVIGAIVRQRMLGDPLVDGPGAVQMEGTMYTSVNWPFELASVQYDTGNDDQGNPIKDRADVNYVTSVDAETFPYREGNTEGVDVPCDLGEGCDLNAWANGQEDAVGCVHCEHWWWFRLQPSSDAVCDLNGRYGLTWDLICRNGQKAQDVCPIDSNTPPVRISFKVRSSYACPTVVDQIAFSVTSLEAYEEDSHTTPKDDFLHLQTSFFKGSFQTADVSVTSTRIIAITLVRPNKGVQPNLVSLYSCDANHDNCAPSASGIELGIANVQSHTVTTPAPNAASHPTFELTWDTTSTTMGLGDDEREVLQVRITALITYTNAGQSLQAPKTIQVARTTPLSALVKRQGQVAQTSVSVGFANVSSSTTLFGFSFTQMGAAAGAAVVVAGAVIGLTISSSRRRRRRLVAKARSQANMLAAGQMGSSTVELQEQQQTNNVV